HSLRPGSYSSGDHAPGPGGIRFSVAVRGSAGNRTFCRVAEDDVALGAAGSTASRSGFGGCHRARVRHAGVHPHGDTVWCVAGVADVEVGSFAGVARRNT